MKLVSFKRAGSTSWGIAADGGVVDVGGRLSGRFPTMRSALEADAIALIAQDAKGAEVDLPWSAIALLPPITDPDKIIGFGLNYREHVIESGQPIPSRLISARGTAGSASSRAKATSDRAMASAAATRSRPCRAM